MTELTVALERPSTAQYRPVGRKDAKPPTQDERFQRLLGRDAWHSLPQVVRDRFSKVLASGTSRVFVGTVAETTLSRAGRLLARLARIVGGPLPDTGGATGPATVVVTEDRELGGAHRHGELTLHRHEQGARRQIATSSAKY